MGFRALRSSLRPTSIKSDPLARCVAIAAVDYAQHFAKAQWDE
jgi:hypothetical protein